MGWGCYVGMHRWSGWRLFGGSLFEGSQDGRARWERECLSCGEPQRTHRRPAGLCDDEEDHEWEGSWFRPLKREAVDRDGATCVQSYKRCQRCPAERVFSTSEDWEEEDDG